MKRNPKLFGRIEFSPAAKFKKATFDGVDFPSLAWDIYNFINAYKRGVFGEVPLGQAMNEHFVNFKQNYLKGVKEFGGSK